MLRPVLFETEAYLFARHLSPQHLHHQISTRGGKEEKVCQAQHLFWAEASRRPLDFSSLITHDRKENKEANGKQFIMKAF